VEKNNMINKINKMSNGVKKAIFTFLITAFAFSATIASAASFAKYDGVDGESSDSTDALELEARTMDSSVPGIDPDEVGGTPAETTGGNAETTWKVEEGEKTPGVEPDEIDAPAMEGDAEITLKAMDSEEKGGTEDMNIGIGELVDDGLEPDEIDNAMRQKSNFAILLRSGGDDDSDGDGIDDGLDTDSDGATTQQLPGVEPDEIDLAADGGAQMMVAETMMADEQQQRMDADTILQAVQETTDVPIEIVALNHEEEELEATVRHTVRLFGFIPIEARVGVIIDADEAV